MSAEPSTQGTGRNIRIGKYEVVAHIASGGMGAVYRALDTENSREVALKVMTPEMAAKPAMLERFRREARSGLKLQHEIPHLDLARWVLAGTMADRVPDSCPFSRRKYHSILFYTMG